MNMAFQLHFTNLLGFDGPINYEYIRTGSNLGSVGKIYPT